MKNLVIETSYKTLYDKLIKENEAKKIHYEAGAFKNLPKDIIFYIINFLDMKSLIALTSSCKMFYLILIKCVLENIRIPSFHKKFLSIIKTYDCKNWALINENNDFVMEGSMELYSVGWSPDWSEQIEKEISQQLVCCEEVMARCTSIAEGVMIEITIKLPDEFKLFSIKKLSELLELPIGSSQESEKHLISDDFIPIEDEPPTEKWVPIP